MLEASVSAIRAGIYEVRHFEELVIFGEGIGVDRISDIVCNVLKNDFVRYTQVVARRHGLPTTPVSVRHAEWDQEHRRWIDRTLELPRNPFIQGTKGILLTPGRFLRHIPTADPSDFWDWSWTNHNEQLRADFNYDIGRHVDGRTIARLARRHPQYVRDFMSHLEQTPPSPYDFQRDPSFVNWYEAGRDIAGSWSLGTTPANAAGFCDFIGQLLSNFRHAVEEGGAWRLLWNDDGTPRGERSAQDLFRSVLVHYCRANDIDISGESNAGRGPVDFKFSQGWQARAATEVKLANNSRYWHGLTTQTPIYMNSEQVSCAYFVSVGFRDVDFEEDRIRRVNEATNSLRQMGIEIRTLFIDARERPSASRA